MLAHTLGNPFDLGAVTQFCRDHELYLIEDNEYAISVPVEVNTAGGSISKLVASFPDLFIQEVDGCDFGASHGVMRRAVQHVRDRKGPTFVHAHVIRPYSHSLSDDVRLYRSERERAEEAKQDPIARFERYLLDRGIASEEMLEQIRQQTDREVAEAADRAVAAPKPPVSSIELHVYSSRGPKGS